MSSDKQTEIIQTSAGSWELDAIDEPTQSPENPLHRLHRLFRNRYHWLVLVMIIGATIGGVMGYRNGKQTYQSQGIIEVKPQLPKLLYTNEQNAIMPMFDGYVQRLVALMRSPRVIEMAMSRDEWQKFGYGRDIEARHAFTRSLHVSTAAGSQLLYINFVDDDPQTAQAAVQSVVATFLKIYEERDIHSVDKKIQLLEKLRVDKLNELRSIRSRIMAIANEFGSDALADRYRYQFQELQKLETARESVKLQLVSAESMTANNPKAGDELAMELADNDLLMSDRLGSQYLQRQRSLVMELETLQRKYGPEHRLVKNTQQDIDLVNEMIATRLQEIQNTIDAGGEPSQVNFAGMTNAQRVEGLKQQLEQLNALYEQRYAETLALGRKNLQIDNLKAEMQTVQARLEDADNRIEQLKVESSGLAAGRLETLSNGDRPTRPNKDTRVKYAGAFGFGGAAAGFALILLISLIDSRLRSADDAATTMPNVNMLGILPELPTNLNDPEAALKASRAVHQIRTLLQLTSPSDGSGSAACVTSPAPGSGKTSLTHALGISFALAGTRTLLIDLDLAGGGLTRRTGAAVRRRLGDILRRSGRLNDQQIEQALDESAQSNEMLGQSLVRLNYITEDELTFALEAQTTSILGTIDALNGEPIENCVARSMVPGLEVLPLGNAGAHDVSRISPKAVGKLIDRAKQTYDAVLIDTGPMPACLEASMVASRTDASILIVPRNTNRAMTQRALAQLGKVGARVAGVVFNRANEADFRGSVASTMQISGELSAPIDSRPLKTDAPDNYDPLARAVYSYAILPDDIASSGSSNGKHDARSRKDSATSRS